MYQQVLKERKYAGLGWKPGLPDPRDHWQAVPDVPIPDFIDLAPGFPPCYAQLQLGSCVSNAIAGALQYDQTKQGMPLVMPSRLFIYFNGRVIEGDVGVDGGMEIRDGMKIVANLGDCSENTWPYDMNAVFAKPSDTAYTEASQHLAVQYARVPQDQASLKATLVSGWPVVFGFTVFEAFEGAEVERTGIVPMPTGNDTIVGGHAVVMVGYDDRVQRWKCRNSWNTDWGDSGYFYLPYGYEDPSYADDFWIIEHIS